MDQEFEAALHPALYFMKMLSEYRRLRIVTLLYLHGELSVSEMIAHLSVPQSAVSHALADLRQAGIIACRRVGRNALYSLADDKQELIGQVIGLLMRQFPKEFSQPGFALRDHQTIHADTRFRDGGKLWNYA